MYILYIYILYTEISTNYYKATDNLFVFYFLFSLRILNEIHTNVYKYFAFILIYKLYRPNNNYIRNALFIFQLEIF